MSVNGKLLWEKMNNPQTAFFFYNMNPSISSSIPKWLHHILHFDLSHTLPSICQFLSLSLFCFHPKPFHTLFPSTVTTGTASPFLCLLSLSLPALSLSLIWFKLLTQTGMSIWQRGKACIFSPIHDQTQQQLPASSIPQWARFQPWHLARWLAL